jgi:DNA-binding MurR/RpiR family transcriptional regulator
VDKIRHTLDGVSREAFEGTINALVNARNIYVMGVRSSSMLAGFFCYNLHMIFDNIRLIETTAGSELFQQIMNIGEGDVMVAISFPRYSKRVIKAVEFATRAGADVVALTDSADAPIAHSARQVLIAQSDMASYVDSLVAPLSLLNALIVAVSRARESEVRERLHKLESIWEEYEVYETNQG